MPAPVAIVLASDSATMSFEPLPGARQHGLPVPNDLSGLMHSCTEPDCTFCAWRKENPIELWWERLLDPEEACSSHTTLCGVDPTSSQLLDPSSDLSTQQTTEFLSNFSDELYFPKLDAEFEQVSTQVETSTSQPKPVSSLPITTCTTCTVTSITTTCKFKHVYGSPKGREAIQSARAASIPT